MIASAVEAVKSLATNIRRDTPDAVLAPDERPQPLACPICDSAMIVREATQIDETGVSHFALHAMRCDTCGMVLDRLYHPTTGYEVGVPI